MQLLEVLEQDAALALHDRLGQAGGARRVEHPQRVVEGQLLEASARSLRRRSARPSRCASLDRPGAEVAAGRRCARATASRARSARDDVAAVEVLAAVAVAVDARAGPSARSARSGRRPSARRSPASSDDHVAPIDAHASEGRRPPRGCSACRRRRGRRGRRRARAGRPRAARACVAQLAPGHLGAARAARLACWIASASSSRPRKMCSA